MASQIAHYKLEKIASKLASEKYDDLIKEAETWLVDHFNEYIWDVIDPKLLELYNKSGSFIRNCFKQAEHLELNKWDVGIGFGSRYAELWVDCPDEDFHKIQRLANNTSFYVSIRPKEIIFPCGDNHAITVKLFVSNADFRKHLLNKIEYIEAKSDMINKLNCVLKAKRYYPNSLKNDFPEAYEMYKKCFPGDFATDDKPTDSKPKEATRESININTVRELLNS